MIDKAKVFKFGEMVLNMKEHGKIMWLMEKENSGTLMEISMMDNGRMISQMDMGFTNFKMAINMKVILIITNTKALVK
jgi:hypothetical protein